jgi:hypothetical protein
VKFRVYPTATTMPSRKQRKALRKQIFAENKGLRGRIKQAKRKAKKESNDLPN